MSSQAPEERKRRKIRLEDLLNNNIWDVDPRPHIKLDTSKCRDCNYKPCVLLCPTGCYTTHGDDVLFSYEGCVECGTCRVVCPEEAITWEYPRSGRGIHFRFS